jgi:hypothetical protein
MSFVKSFLKFLYYIVGVIVSFLLFKVCLSHIGDKEIYQPFLSMIGILSLGYIFFYITFKKLIENL